MLAPIVLFTYNRLTQTQKTIEALQSNPLAKESELFIYSDAARSTPDILKVQEVRAYLKNIDGFKNIKIIEQKTNQGLATSIIKGVSDVVNKYGKIIVLEDDIMVAPNFLNYMNEALEFYKEKKEVWHIAGFQFPINTDRFPNKSTSFVRAMNCWGWSTWQDRWVHFEREPAKTMHSFTDKQIKEINCHIEGIQPYWVQVKANYEGVMNTWDIFWYVTIFLNQGLCLSPIRTFVKNIGYDGSGEHCSPQDDKIFNSKSHLLNTQWTFENDIKEDMDLLDEIRIFYMKIYHPKLNIFQKIVLYTRYFTKKSPREKFITILRRLHLHK